MNKIHKELIDYCRKYEFNIIEFTNIEEAKKQCDVLIEKYLLHFGEGLH